MNTRLLSDLRAALLDLETEGFFTEIDATVSDPDAVRVVAGDIKNMAGDVEFKNLTHICDNKGDIYMPVLTSVGDDGVFGNEGSVYMPALDINLTFPK